jgi:S1-C subfamily serine protease
MSLKKILTSALKITALAALIFTVSVEAPFVHKAYIRSIAEESVVRIVSATGKGTGFHVKLPNGKVVILTNKHVCEMNPVLEVETDGMRFPIVRKIIKISDRHDLCVMEGIPGKQGISIGSDPTLGDTLYTLGHPRGEELNVASGEYFGNTIIKMGHVLKVDELCLGEIIPGGYMFTPEGLVPVQVCLEPKNTIHVSSPTYPGNSGSAVVNKYGNLVGVIFAGNPSIENNGYAVPLSYVIEFLSTI